MLGFFLIMFSSSSISLTNLFFPSPESLPLFFVLELCFYLSLFRSRELSLFHCVSVFNIFFPTAFLLFSLSYSLFSLAALSLSPLSFSSFSLQNALSSNIIPCQIEKKMCLYIFPCCNTLQFADMDPLPG